MKCRYTPTAAAEFDDSVGYLLKHAPHVAAKFADSIDNAVNELLEFPYAAQQTELAGVYRKYVRAFRYSIFYAVDIASDELVILNIRHAARRWPWQESAVREF
jgi:plasmid stabilization system protein ParE